MMFTKNLFMRSPGGESEDSSKAYNSDDNKENTDGLSRIKKEGEEKKTLSDKIHDALQDWSNDDQSDQEFDDRRP